MIDPTLPHELVHIVECGLAKARDERYQHMSEMLMDLAVYRQRINALDSPGSGHAAPTEMRTPSGRAILLTPSGRPIPLTPSGRPIPLTPAGPQTPVSNPLPPPPASGTASGPADRGFRTVALFAVALLALSVAGVAMWKSMRSPAAPTESAAPPPAVAAPTVSDLMKTALTAFEAEDYSTAVRGAEAVLARDPSHVQARELRDRARTSGEAVDRGLTNARALFDKGRFEEASRAAGEVLSVAPGNREAQRIMEEGAARSRGQGAEEARTRVARARAAARSADAPRLASAAYSAASAAEREAQRLYTAGRLGDATVKFYQASGLFRSAEVAAQNEASTRLTAAREAAERDAAARESAARQPLPAPPKPADPEMGRTPGVSPPPVPAAPAERTEPSQVPAPAPTPSAPPTSNPTGSAPSTPAESASAREAAAKEAAAREAAAREAAVADVLGRYESAVESRSLDAMKRIWPGLNADAMRREFEHASRISVEIVDPRITVSGDTATVTFVRRYDVVTVEREPLHSESHATMDLRRSGNSWVIERIRFVQTR
jgi:tetratricopeptide (TPR) repeat protein